MDFLDTRDSIVSKKRSRRVRSWYLYEQFKSLEKNQVQAAEKLKERSYQDKILRQELCERRARRKLYDQIGITASESVTEKNSQHNNEEDKILCSSSEELFSNYADLQEYVIQATEPNQSDSLNDDDYKTVEDHDQATIETSSLTDVPSEETMIHDLRASETNVDPIDSHFDQVNDESECLEKLTELGDEADVRSVSVCSDDLKQIAKKDMSIYAQDNSLLTMWSKVVTFAYQVIELNNGNCYYDYGSQLLTAVLACDVLRRGINKMCDILQPYVSPIKFATDSYSDNYHNNYCHKSVRRKKTQNKNNKNNIQFKMLPKCKQSPRKLTRKYRSEHWQHSARSIDRRNNMKLRSSEPLRRDRRNSYLYYASTKSSSSLAWPDFSNDSSKLCSHCGSRVFRPMFKLSQYIDSIIKEIEEKYE